MGKNLRELSGVRRFEIITTNGRELIKYFAPGSLKYDFQDNGDTLKLFLMEPSVPGWRYNGKHFTVSDLRVIAKMYDNMFIYGFDPTMNEVVYAINALKREGLPFEEVNETTDSTTEASDFERVQETANNQ